MMSSIIQAITTVEEFRGSWIATSYNIDWPSKSGLSINNQKQEYINHVDELKATGMNSVVMQIRAMGDAFYPSKYAPWSKYITGTLGKDPGYDPLSFALDYVHQKNMKFHAWFNPFRISTDSSFNKDDYMNKLPSGSPLKSHPEWIVNYADYYWLNLAKPEVRSYVIDTIMEVATKYNVDGIHLDDYFYPYPKNNAEFPDEEEFKTYGSGYKSKADWRRDNVNKFISQLSSKIKSAGYSIKLGVSPFGIWRNGIQNGGADTNGLSSYDDLYCDSLKWVNMGWIDYIIPQIYWNIGYGPVAYEKLAVWWANNVQGKNVYLHIGHAAYKVGKGSTYGAAWDNPEEIPNQIKLNRTYSSINGSCFFSTKDILANPLGLKNRLSTDLYNQQPTNAEVINDWFYVRDASGKIISGRVDIGDKIQVLDISYSKQLVLVKYPTPNGSRTEYIKNIPSNIRYFYEYEWQNGSTSETVYQDSKCTQPIGTISPYERATPLYRENGILHVAYNTKLGKHTKSGYVKYNGRFTLF